MGKDHLSLSFALDGSELHVVHPEECPDIGPICNVRDEPPQLHDQTLLVGNLRVDAEYGIASGWSVELLAGVRAVRDQIIYRDPETLAPKTLDYENIHHRNETLAGPTDPSLMLRRGLSLDELHLALSGRAGVTLPIGFTVPDPYALGALGLPHEHVQFGTGTFDPLLGAEARLDFHSPVNGSLNGYAQATFVPYADAYGYRAGNRYTAGLAFAWKLHFTGPILRLGVLAYREEAENWRTTPTAAEGNLGRTDVFVDIGGVWRLSNDWTASVNARINVASDVQGAQFHYPGAGEIGASKLLHLHGAEMSD